MDLIFRTWVYFIPPFLQNQVAKPSTNSEQVSGSKPCFFLGQGQIQAHHFEIIIPSLGVNQQIITTSKYWVDHEVTSLLGAIEHRGSLYLVGYTRPHCIEPLLLLPLL